MRDWPFLERRRTLTTVAATQAYELPYDCDQVRSVSVSVSSVLHTPRQSPSRDHWDKVNAVTSSSNTPEWWFVFNGQLLLWPTPVSASNSIYVTQKTRVIDLNVADYTTGTIVSIANGAAAVVGSGTSWTSQMVGRWIRITMSDTANTGDGVWYEIAGVTDTTHLTLDRLYGGTSIAAGSATYNIGQMPLLPESFHDLPWLWAAGMYWDKESDSRGQKFFNMHGNIGSGSIMSTGRVKVLESTWSSSNTDMVVDDGDSGDIMINPNLLISI